MIKQLLHKAFLHYRIGVVGWLAGWLDRKKERLTGRLPTECFPVVIPSLIGIWTPKVMGIASSFLTNSQEEKTKKGRQKERMKGNVNE